MKIIFIFFIVVAAVLLLLIFGVQYNQATAHILDSFAQCLAEKKIVMYGADWCPHCQNEKRAFGSSFKYVHYVECPRDPKLCLQERINGYPTWIFSDGKRLVGEQGLEKLSQESGCPVLQQQ